MAAATHQARGFGWLASWWVLVAIIAAIVVTPLVLAAYVMFLD
jgi:hypothetical protein